MKILILTMLLTGILTSTANAYYCPVGMDPYDCVRMENQRQAEIMMQEANDRYNASKYGYQYNYYSY